jgi:hypothetical protein
MTNQSDLTFIENNKSCVFCTFNTLEFYWERSYTAILITSTDKFNNFEDKIYLPKSDLSTASDARKEIVQYLKGAFNV